MKHEILERLKSEILILDGSMGALLQGRGLPNGYAPDLWNLERPKDILAVHQEYIQAGSDIVLANTFGASKIRLDEYNAYGKLKDINFAAVDLAKKAFGEKKGYVAGDIGPCGTTVAPFGELAFNEAIDIFYEQMKALVEAGADLIAIETMFDLQEMRAALIAANQVREIRDLPIMAHMTFTQDGLTDTGSDPDSVVTVLDGFNVDILGLNCSTGPEHMEPVIEKIAAATGTFISIEPNAGLPIMKNGVTIFPATPQEMAPYAEKFVDIGANVVGGCCGTTPEYIRLITERLKKKKPLERTTPSGTKICSRMNTVYLGEGHPFVKIGEKINPTGRKKFSEAIKEGRMDLVLAEARKQFEAGATALDVNVGVPLVDEPAMMAKAVVAIQNVVNLPLVIDSSYDEALELGMLNYPGKALVNSVNAEDEKIEAVLPLIKKYGAAVIALVAETEIPETAVARLKNAEKILKAAMDLGIPKENVVFDVLALTVSAMQKGSSQSLDTIRLIKQELGCATTLGLSNVSFGLPNRKWVHNTFLAQAIASGLDSAICNPMDEVLQNVVRGAALFTGRDNECKTFVAFEEKKEADRLAEESGEVTKKKVAETTAEKIYEAVLEGYRDNIAALTQEGLDEGMSPFDIFIEVMTPAIRELGDLFGARKKFIPHLVASADTMKRGVEVLQPLLEAAGGVESKGTIIMATVKGDIHDIGKNICCIMLRNFGYKVFDLGRNVPADDILEAAKRENADCIGLSALMTTTMMQMKVVIDEVKAKALPYKVVIGGAVTTKQFADEIQADGYGKDVGKVVPVVESVMEKASSK